MRSKFQFRLLATVAVLIAVPATSWAQDASSQQLQQVESQIQSLQAQLQEMKAQSAPEHDAAPPIHASGAHVSIDKGRPTIASDDGRFSATLRVLGQFDMADYMQSGSAKLLPSANGPELSDGANVRRAWFGLQGVAFGDWSYFANFDFGGSNGTESPGHIQSLYVQYDGLKPFAFRAGVFPDPANLDDGVASADLPFLERAQPSDMSRNLVGADGRDAASLLYLGHRFFGALSLSGGKVGDGPVFQEQLAAVGRLSALVLSSDDASFLVSASGTDLFQPPATTVGPTSLRTLTLAEAPELTVDSNGTKLISTGAIDADKYYQWSLEAAGNWRSLYAQGGYYGYQVDPQLAGIPDYSFSGWYGEATWTLTGEVKAYNPLLGAFSAPQPAVPFSLENGTWGAWELAARYSDLDLNDRAGVATLPTPTGGIRGGEQKILTLGVNWYPNSNFRFLLDYQHVDVSRLDPLGANVGQKFQTVALRLEIEN